VLRDRQAIRSSCGSCGVTWPGSGRLAGIRRGVLAAPESVRTRWSTGWADYQSTRSSSFAAGRRVFDSRSCWRCPGARPDTVLAALTGVDGRYRAICGRRWLLRVSACHRAAGTPGPACPLPA
jgi:hypothetical protein